MAKNCFVVEVTFNNYLQLCFCMHPKQVLNYLAVCENFFCIVHVITIYTIKTPQFFSILLQLLSRTLLDPKSFSRCLWHDSKVYRFALRLPTNRSNILEVIFCNLTENSCPIRYDIKELMGMSIQQEIDARTHFHAKHGSKTI